MKIHSVKIWNPESCIRVDVHRAQAQAGAAGRVRLGKGAVEAEPSAGRGSGRKRRFPEGYTGGSVCAMGFDQVASSPHLGWSLAQIRL